MLNEKSLAITVGYTPFMEPGDLLFYLYAMVIEYGKDKEIVVLTIWVAIDRDINTLKDTLLSEDQDSLKNDLQQIWEIGSDDYADF